MGLKDYLDEELGRIKNIVTEPFLEFYQRTDAEVELTVGDILNQKFAKEIRAQKKRGKLLTTPETEEQKRLVEKMRDS